MTDQRDPELIKFENEFIFAETKRDADLALAQIVKLLPNDQNLGEYIRNIYQLKMWK